MILCNVPQMKKHGSSCRLVPDFFGRKACWRNIRRKWIGKKYQVELGAFKEYLSKRRTNKD